MHVSSAYKFEAVSLNDCGKSLIRLIQKLEYLKNEKSFLDEIKNIVHSF